MQGAPPRVTTSELFSSGSEESGKPLPCRVMRVPPGGMWWGGGRYARQVGEAAALQGDEGATWGQGGRGGRYARQVGEEGGDEGAAWGQEVVATMLEGRGKPGGR